MDKYINKTKNTIVYRSHPSPINTFNTKNFIKYGPFLECYIRQYFMYNGERYKP